jgi:hypothetical protein
MSDPVAPLVLDLLEWIGAHPRPYREVMEAWRTSCPRLPVWETANEQGLLEHRHPPSSEALVGLSAQGRKLLSQRRLRARATA